ncbi:MAG: HAMP domain-containing protein [Rubrobacteridae bacterium]|nr:HAMP domain-containing protein [Rubrobacteridae bacterium]
MKKNKEKGESAKHSKKLAGNYGAHKKKESRYGLFALAIYSVICIAVLAFAIKSAIMARDNLELLSVLIIAVLNISIMLVFQLLTIKRIQTPLTKLTDAAEQMVQGDYDSSIRIDGDEEVERLGETFNKLRNVMKASSRSADNYVKELQSRVAELGFMVDLNNTILSFENLNAVYSLIAEKACDILKGDMCCIVLRSKEDFIQIKS